MYERIEQMLAERGETFADLARGAGIKMSTIYMFKARRENNLSALNAMKVAEYLGVSLNWLYKGEE